MDPLKHERNLLEIFPTEIWACIAVYLTGEELALLKLTGANNLWRKLKSTNVVKSLTLGTDYLQFTSWPAFLNEFPSVSKLCLCSASIEKWSEWSPNLSSLPNTLRKLKICGEVGDWASFFHSSEGIKLNFEAQVPHLEVLDLRLSNFASVSNWYAQVPTTLTKLRLVRWNGDFELPPTLIHFEARTGIKLKSSNTKLPPRLEVLESYAIDGLRFLVPLLPPTLRKLHFYFWGNQDGTFLRQVPSSLETLGMVSFPVSPELISLLPPSLTDLWLTDSGLPADCWYLLPRTLKKLQFRLVRNFYENDSSVDEKQSESTYPLHLLPRSITELNLTDETHYTILRGFIELPAPNSNFPIGSQFPPYLTTFTAPECQLTPNATKHLPASLTNLSIFWLCERVCEHLPRGLTSLKATYALMSPTMINFLPPRLLSLELGYAPHSQKMIDYSNPGNPTVIVSSLPGFSAHQEYETNKGWLGDQSLPLSLTKIVLNYFEHVGDSFARQYLPNAIELDLGSTQDFTDLAIPLLGRHLKVLNLMSAVKITGQCFASLPRALESLWLNSSSIYDSDIQHLPRNLLNIFIRSAVHLTDECVQAFPRHAEHIRIEDNNLLTTASFPNLPYPIKTTVYGRPTIFATDTWEVSGGKIEVSD